MTPEGFSQQDSNAIRESLQTTNMVNFIRLVKVSIHNQIHKDDHEESITIFMYLPYKELWRLETPLLLTDYLEHFREQCSQQVFS